MLIQTNDNVVGDYLTLLIKPSKVYEQARLKKFIKENLENYKRPREIKVVEEIPHTYNGKKDRKKSSNF